jgi:hypothetical protein
MGEQPQVVAPKSHLLLIHPQSVAVTPKPPSPVHSTTTRCGSEGPSSVNSPTTTICGSEGPISCWFTHNPYTFNCNSPCSLFFWLEDGGSKFLQTVHTFLPPYGITSQKTTTSIVTVVITSYLDYITSASLLLSNSTLLRIPE